MTLKCPPGLDLEGYFRHYMPEDPPPSGCWLWRGPVRADGYGQIRIRVDGRRVGRIATNVAYEMFVGSLSDELQINHHCDTPLCCQPGPGHMYAGSQIENISDMVSRDRTARGEGCRHNRLTQEQVDSIRLRYATGGVLQKTLGQEYGCSAKYISKIIRGEKWRGPKI
jgi:hypothetical protein